MALYAGTVRQRRRTRPSAARFFVTVPAAAAALIGAAIVVPRCVADMERWEGAPAIEYTVQPGDTLTSYAQGEGLSGKDIRRYVGLVSSAHDYVSNKGRKPVGTNGMIYAGDTLRLPDVNRDGKVGPPQ